MTIIKGKQITMCIVFHFIFLFDLFLSRHFESYVMIIISIGWAKVKAPQTAAHLPT